MKKTTATIAIFLVLAMFACAFYPMTAVAQSDGRTYFVDSENGNDGNSGLTQANAWRTTSRVCAETYLPGDKILYKSGQVFVGAFTAKGSGTVQSPVYVGAYGGETKPVLTTVDSSAAVNLCDVSYWTVENLDITSPSGGGVVIRFGDTTVYGITLKNLTLHDINNYPSDTYKFTERAALRILGNSTAYGTHIEDLLVDGCEIYDCGYGIGMWGNYPNIPAAPYNKNITVQNCSIHDLWDDAFVLSRAENIIFRNSSVLNTTLSAGVYYTAPVWTWGVSDGLIENVEIGGAKNYMDGMAVDFDDHTDSTTYQYIYSHDNICFFWSCVYTTDHFDNTVRYCLSVNDNVRSNGFMGSDFNEDNFAFYNNTIVNGSSFDFSGADNAIIQNNIFSLQYGKKVSFDRHNSYTVSNNCYNNIFVPLADKAPVIRNARFAGDDEDDKNSYKLSVGSPCIGSGVRVEENMGERDFFGNPLGDTHNIGCYEGGGEASARAVPASFAELYAAIINAILSVFTRAGIC